ncbi:MAG: DUF1553 domain-containing protein [Planctomycetota bacterium]
MRYPVSRLKSATVILVCIATMTAHADQKVDFNRDVRPILSDKCYFCHGPDEENREADLRLDVRSDEALSAFESGELVDRIHSDDEDVVMPPPSTKLKLSDKEKRILGHWIDDGAQYEEHWAFQSLAKSVSLPSVKNAGWCKQPLDQFVLANLESAGKHPADEAAALRWLRRATLDLTGLPPTLEQIDKFEKSLAASGEKNRNRVYEQVVDDLLKSPAYGEHFAVAWLDAARYADSYGYQSDKLNTQWPYRDWVVRALNDNLPYDKFLTWQLAGDLMPNPTLDKNLATAYNRLHRLNNEGGAVFEEWRIENVADRVHTFGTAVLGLTLECCRCHDHKYDPISARDYYSLSAFFNSIDESGVYDRTAKVPAPSMLLPTAEQQKAIEQSLLNLADAERKYEAAVATARDEFEAWKKAAADNGPLPIPDLRLALSFDKPFENSLKKIYHPSQNDRGWTSPLDTVEVADSQLSRLDPKSSADSDKDSDEPSPRRAIKLDGERGITTSGIEPFDRWTPFTVLVSLRETERVPERAVIAHHTRGTDCGYNGWDLTIVNGHLESRMYRVWPGNAMGVRTTEPIPADKWVQVAATYDGSSKAAGLKLYLNGKQLETTTIRDRVKKSANVKVDHGGQFVLGQRFRARGLAGGLVDDVRIYLRDLVSAELDHLANGTELKPDVQYFASAVHDEARQVFAQLNDARKAAVMAEEAAVEIPIMEETETARETHVLARGQYDAATSDETRVDRNTFTSVLPPFPADARRDRLGLAKWVTDPDHPLTSRVIVNRLWSNFFGVGLVESSENFGLQGALPTNPELLDWLARDFVDNGWDMKRFCKQVVLSATYRQDSKSDPAMVGEDPDNQLLARGPAFRLSAEQIRDSALAASGLLNESRGGPPVSPYQAGGDLWKESNGMSPPYKQSVGKALYRRSLYSVWKRTAPLPNMMAFDAESREVCTVKRSRTNTPLQALVLMNDVQFVEAARRLAEKSMKLHQQDAKRITWTFRSLAGRSPDEREEKLLTKLLNDERAYYAEHTEEATKLLELGDSAWNEDFDADELAAMTTVCQAVLNLDATIWKR